MSPRPPEHRDPNDRRARLFRLESGAARVTRDVDEEMLFHLEMRQKKLEALGHSPDDARREALRQFGDVASVRNECITIDREHLRVMNRASFLQDLSQDVRYAVRSLGNNKVFTFITVLILALGIGSNTAIFSLLDALLLRQLPVGNAGELVVVGNPERLGSTSQGSPRFDHFSAPLFQDVRSNAKTLSGVFATGRSGRLDVFVEGAPSNAEADHPVGRVVSGNYFSVLQVQPALGRVFSADEDRSPGTAPVVVLSYDYWRARHNSDPKIVGRVLRINNTSFTVIGVAPQKFKGEIADRTIDLFIPLGMHGVLNPNMGWLERRDVSWLMLIGRRAPGVTTEQVRAEMQALVSRSLLENAEASVRTDVERDLKENPVQVESAAQGLSFYRSSYKQSLVTLMAAVALVLIVVCANVANLLLARATARAREMSVRMALGAKRLRLIQQLLTESLIIAIAGGALGVIVAIWASKGLLRLANGRNSGIILDTGIDARLLIFSGALSLLTALLFGIMPALSATRVELASALRAAGRNVAGTGGKFSAGRMLVVAQVALSVLLLAGTGMLLRSLQRLNHADIGADREHVVIGALGTQRLGYDSVRTAQLQAEIVSRLQKIPGVLDVALSANGIFSGSESRTTFRVEGFTGRTADDSSSTTDRVGPHFFRTVGARMIAGREFDETDNLTGRGVAVVNESFVKHFFPDGRAIGKHIYPDEQERTYEIVGVVADINTNNLRSKVDWRFYLAMNQDPDPSRDFYIQMRTSGDPLKTIAPTRAAILDADRGINIARVDVLNQLVDDTVAQDRLVAQVATVFGTLTLILSALGLYGVMAYATVRRTTEFGLRLALGALPTRIVGMVLREALTLTAAGVMVGVPLAYGMSQLLRDQLYGIEGVDIPSIVIAIVVLTGAATLAGYLPAMRASKVAPLEALRAD
ncbi:MAG: ADOP family duplicated permease [Gemmatimonas sp.]